MNAAQLQKNGKYKSVLGTQEFQIHPSSVLWHSADAWVVFHEVLQTSEKFMREVTVIEPLWLYQIAPHFYEYRPFKKEERDKAAAAAASIVGSGLLPSSESQPDPMEPPQKKHRELF